MMWRLGAALLFLIFAPTHFQMGVAFSLMEKK
jgi:hypothetical protein